jgi:hypothetical protein
VVGGGPAMAETILGVVEEIFSFKEGGEACFDDTLKGAGKDAGDRDDSV